MILRRRRRIAYVVPMGSGLEAFVYRELEALHDMGYRFVLFATKFKKDDVFSPKDEWPYRTLTPLQFVWRSPLLFLRLLMHPLLTLEALRIGGLLDLVFALDYAPAMKKMGVDQIHCHHGDHKLFIGYYCKRLTGLPLSVTIHAAEFYTNPNLRLFRKAILECDGVFPISEKWHNKLAREYGVPGHRLRLNRLFVDVGRYKPSTVLTVIAVGRFTERKGFEYLLRAAALLSDIDVHFCIIGFGPLNVRGIARRLGVDGRVTVFDKLGQDEIRYMFQHADILCVPSITTKEEGAEGIPVVLMEGMACGLPVVATKCGAIDEIVEEILVDERSEAQLADAIRYLADNPEVRERQGRRNREIVIGRYSKENVRRFAHHLDELLS